MKKLTCAVLLGLILGAALPAQEQGQQKFAGEAEIYCRTIPIAKIYSYQKGFVVQYWSRQRGVELAYIPLEWFREEPRKAEMITFGAGSMWPALTLVYKDGVFQRCIIYAHRNQSHISWGTVPFNVNIDGKFDGVTELKLKF